MYICDTIQGKVDDSDNIPTDKRFQLLDIHDILTIELPPREDILSPVLQTQSLSMVFAKRGVGKTHIALGMAHALATAGRFLKWQAPKRQRVLYIDGEMPMIAMQQRMLSLIKQTGATPLATHFNLITPDFNYLNGMPDLGCYEDQERLHRYTQNFDVIFIDNISTLARSTKENEAESWSPIQHWALQMRSQGKSVVFVHHAGKGGQQRGTSRREDVLDTVIELRHPDDYQPEQGARFEVHLTKARNLCGDAAKSFEAQFDHNGWSWRDIEDARQDQVKKLRAEGLTLREIKEQTNLPSSTIHRWLKKEE